MRHSPNIQRWIEADFSESELRIGGQFMGLEAFEKLKEGLEMTNQNFEFDKQMFLEALEKKRYGMGPSDVVSVKPASRVYYVIFVDGELGLKPCLLEKKGELELHVYTNRSEVEAIREEIRAKTLEEVKIYTRLTKEVEAMAKATGATLRTHEDERIGPEQTGGGWKQHEVRSLKGEVINTIHDSVTVTTTGITYA